ncbi:hypothetical protein [Mesorhizobium sp. M0037]|uniref:hypothetical protein n=1 Tax=unclassified Mesorhizobium TaxID=325217 RepID=UPI0033352180
MDNIDIYYQGETIRSFEHLEIGAEEAFASLQSLIAKKHGISDKAFLFVEDEDDPVEAKAKVRSKAGRSGVKVHIHRCRKVEVVVHFKDKSFHDAFAPGATIARVKHWVAVRKLGMTDEEASHHHLQVTGTTNQPEPSTHIGTLVEHPRCRVEFDLVTTPKVNG